MLAPPSYMCAPVTFPSSWLMPWLNIALPCVRKRERETEGEAQRDREKDGGNLENQRTRKAGDHAMRCMQGRGLHISTYKLLACHARELLREHLVKCRRDNIHPLGCVCISEDCGRAEDCEGRKIRFLESGFGRQEKKELVGQRGRTFRDIR